MEILSEDEKDTVFRVSTGLLPRLNIAKDDVRNIVYQSPEFKEYGEKIIDAFDSWTNHVDDDLKHINSSTELKKFVKILSEHILQAFDGLDLIDKYDVYEVLLSYWQEVMSDDVYLISACGYGVAREIRKIFETAKSGNEKGKEREKGWEGELLPKELVEAKFFRTQRKAITEAQAVVEILQAKKQELEEEQTGEDGVLFSCLNDKDKVVVKEATQKLKALKKSSPTSEEYQLLEEYLRETTELNEKEKLIRALEKRLDEEVRARYKTLTDDEILEILTSRKWYDSLYHGIEALYIAVSHEIANRVIQLAERYESPLPDLEKQAEELDARVKTHLERMGFVW